MNRAVGCRFCSLHFLRRWRRAVARVGTCVLLLVLIGAGCDDPEIVPPPPVEQPPDTILLQATAPAPPDHYEHRLRWHYARLIDPEVVVSYAGESDLLREVERLEPAHPQRVATLDLLYANWDRSPRPAAHVRVALLRLVALLASDDPRTTQALLSGLDDPTMKVRFRANNHLKDIYATDVDFDPNGIEAAPRAAAIARWKNAIATRTRPAVEPAPVVP